MKQNKQTSSAAGAQKLQLPKDRPSPGTASVKVETHNGKVRPALRTKSR